MEMEDEYPYNPLYHLQEQSGAACRECALRGCRHSVSINASYFPCCSRAHREEFFMKKVAAEARERKP